MAQDSQEDAWYTRLLNTTHDFGTALAEFHGSNPWPKRAVLDSALVHLATELWDRGFSQSEIIRAFGAATAHLPNYAAGEERRS